MDTTAAIKPTSGPWFVSGPENFGKASGIGVKHHNQTGPSVIAFMWAEGVEAEQEANARLIAAAPELLASLVEMQKLAGAYPRCQTKRDAMARAKSAIKKATGWES